MSSQVLELPALRVGLGGLLFLAILGAGCGKVGTKDSDLSEETYNANSSEKLQTEFDLASSGSSSSDGRCQFVPGTVNVPSDGSMVSIPLSIPAGSFGSLSLDGSSCRPGRGTSPGPGEICVHSKCTKNVNGTPTRIGLCPPSSLSFYSNGIKVSKDNIGGNPSVKFEDSNYKDNSGTYNLKVKWCPGACTVTARNSNFSGSFSTDQVCGFYQEMAKATGCTKSGDYPLGYGKKYCERFSHLASVSPGVRAWVARTMTCLQEKIKDFCPLNGRSCQDLRSSAFASHASCYTDSLGSLNGTSICDQNLINGVMIGLTVDAGDLATVPSAKQMIETVYRCDQKLGSYVGQYLVEVFKDYTKKQKSDSPPIAKGRSCAKNTSVLSFNSYLDQCMNCCTKAYGSNTNSSGRNACGAVCNAQFTGRW